MTTHFDDCQQGILGLCLPLESSTCLNDTSCEPTEYSVPAVSIAPLPANTDALVDSLFSTEPDGTTPSAPALKGAIEYTHSHAAAHPDRHAVTVLATDGYPTACAPQDIRGISEIAQAGLELTPSIPTYVIGVFTSTESTARADLDTIAKQGGTGEAVIVHPDSDLSEIFGEALNEIRRKSLACEFQIPETDQERIDFSKLNVIFRDGASRHELIFMENSSTCHTIQISGASHSYGWYYDIHPETGINPTRIITCPQTCDILQASPNGSVEILIGCETIGLEGNTSPSDLDDAG